MTPARPERKQTPPVLQPHGRRLHVVAICVAFIVCGAMSLLVGQDNNWDLQNYHHYNAYAFLTGRIGFDIAPAQRQTYLNPFLDLPFYFGTTHLNPRLLGFVMGGIQGLNAYLVFLLCLLVFRESSRKTRVALSGFCAAAGLYGPVFLGELGASQNDTVVSLFVLASLYLLARRLAAGDSLAARESRRALLAAALILGVGAGLKATVTPHVAAFAIAILAVEGTWRKRLSTLAMGGGVFLLGFLLANGYWMLRMWKEFQNPFFPFYNNVFKSPWADPRSYADRSMLPHSFLEAVARPFTFCRENEYTARQNNFRDVRYAILCVVLALYAVRWSWRRWVAWRKRRRSSARGLGMETRFLFVFVVVSFVAWEAMFSIIRYAAVMELLTPLLVAVLASELLRRSAGRTLAIAVGMFVVMMVTVIPIQHERVQWGERFWEVQVPPIKDPAHTVIIMANTRPWAYLIPFFPPEVRWVSLDNNITEPDDKTRMQIEIRRIIQSHTGDMYLVSRDARGWFQHDQWVLAPYRLRVESSVGQPIASKHTRPGLGLWPLRRF